MRAVLLILILGVVVLIALFASGLVDVSQTREARAPQVEAVDGSIRAQAGQSPAFEVQTGSVEVGTREANVAVPKVEVKPGQTKVKVPSVEVRQAEEAQGNAAN
ncbi:MAG TPA: hypothetical protein VFT40_10810 [Sphingomicrobium sp.]|jgi:hypothetical protein|nr:hypothetical protein [Sphingomicrobium sp.]